MTRLRSLPDLPGKVVPNTIVRVYQRALDCSRIPHPNPKGKTMADMSLGETPLILAECEKRGLLRNQTAYVLATAYWESWRTMEPVEEAYHLAGRVADMDGWRQRNLRYYPWHGRGFVQLTWESNYKRLSERLGLDLTSDPRVVMQPDISAQILVIGMQEGLFTGKKLADYVTLQRSDYVGARRIVNGTDKAQAIAEIAREYEAALLAMGFGVEKPAPVVNERRDGTAPRETRTKSKTLWSQAVQWVTLNGAAAWAFYQSQDETTRLLIGGMAIAGTLAGAVVFRDRLRAWAEGWR
jgi:predicted chitinase